MPAPLKTAPFFKKAEESRQVSSLKSKFYISAAIFIASLLYYLSYTSYGFSDGDWGLIVAAAEESLQGNVFYRDFSIIYTPGIYLYTALSFKLFGVSLLSAKIAWSILRAFNCLLIYLVGVRILSYRVALLLPFILWLTPGPLHKSFFVFFELLNFLILIRLMSTDSRPFYFLSGIVAGITLIFRIDLFGFFVMLLLLIEFLKFIDLSSEMNWVSQVTRSFKNLSFFSGGTILAVLPLALFLFSKSAMDDAINQTIGFISFSKGGWSNMPSITQISTWTVWNFISYVTLFVPLVIYSLLLVVVVSDIIAKGTKNKKFPILLLSYGCLLLTQLLTTISGIPRFTQIISVILIADMYLVSRYYIDYEIWYRKKLRLIYPVSLITVNFALLSLIIISCYSSDIYINGSSFIRFRNTAFLSAPRINVYTTYKSVEEFNRTRNIIETTTEKDGYIFALPHAPLMYTFVTGRKNATKYDSTFRYTLSDERRSEVIKNLVDKKVKLIIIDNAKYKFFPAHLVFRYINEHYRFKERVGDRIILTKKWD